MKLAGAMGVGQKWLSVHQTPLPFVLVAEDEELVRLYAADLLTEAGYKVIDVARAEAALEAMAEEPNIRVLFTDIQMPGVLGGIQLARRIHEQWPDVLLLTPALGSCISPAAS